jgi:hypothetical protein
MSSVSSIASAEPGGGARGGGAASSIARSRACLAAAAASAAAARVIVQCSGHATHSRTGSWQNPHQHLSQCCRSNPAESANLPRGKGGSGGGSVAAAVGSPPVPGS